MQGSTLCSALALGSLAATTSAAVAGTDDQLNNYGTFQNPSSNVRPRFRYWANDASLNLSRVAYDVRTLARAGAGGLELLNYALYGETGTFGGQLTAPIQSDWTKYGFGSDAWKNLQDTVLATAKEEDVLVDLAIGPNQGAGVPAPYDDDGLLWDLAAYEANITSGASFNDTLPGWGGAHNSQTLVAATTGLITTQNGSQVTLSSDSLSDLTSIVDSEGRLDVQLNGTSTSDYVLFAFYLKHSETHEVNASTAAPTAVPQSPIENYKQNGSWVVDHFSEAGAQLVINFWNETLLSGSTDEDLRQVGNFFWEDSQEYGTSSNAYWTPKLPHVFEKNRGYSINKYIPLIVSEELAGLKAFTSTYVLDDEDGGQSYVQDYEQTLTELNAVYLTTLTEWSNSLGMQFSCQVGYNLPVDMMANIPLVDGPECETLGFDHEIDAYRQFSGPANLAGKRIISSEAGAIMEEVYQQTVPELLWDLKRSIVGGVNQFVLHGYPFSGNYGNTTWPSFTSFAYLFSDMHGPNQPSWEFSNEWLNWTARTQYIAQSGVPKVDLAFWSKKTAYESISAQYNPTDLLDAGYTYDYLSPDNLDLPEAYVADDILAPNRQAFKAMIIHADSYLTASGAQKLASYAHDGLPIFFVGGLPSNVSGHQRSGTPSIVATVQNLTQLSNVHVVSSTGLVSSLSSIGIQPRAATSTNGTWYTYWRDLNESSTQYVFVYNDATGVALGQGMSSGKITFEATGRPFLYDAWTGDVKPLSSYKQSDTRTTLELQLAGNQSAIIGFQSDDANTTTAMDASTALELLSDASFTMKNWTLTVEAWGPPPDDIYDIEAGPSRINSTYDLETLIPWHQISESLTNVSGRGYYQTTFDWPPATATTNQSTSGAIVDLGAILHTARLLVNGQTVPPLDPTWARVDVGSYLVEGANTVDVVVSTPLGNGLRGIWDQLETSGKPATETVPDPPSVADYGLVQDVKVIPYT